MLIDLKNYTVLRFAVKMNELEKRKFLNEQGYWEIPDGVNTSNFDFNWRPFVYERPYIHQFGTQHQKTSGPRFVVPNNEGIKYQDCQHVLKVEDSNNRCWRPLVNNATIDFSWHPDENDPPYIYVFGNQWYDAETMPTYQYKVKGATEKKYINDVKATLLENADNRAWRPLIQNAVIDKSWMPHPYDPPYIYVFGNQWHDAETMPTYEYRVKGATEKKYVNELKATLLPNTENRYWRPLISNAVIDQSWTPHPYDPPYIYVFGNQWHDAETMPTYQYRVNGATEKKYVNNVKAVLLPNKNNWTIPDNIDDSNFDYSWVPNPYEPDMNYEFGTQWQKTGGPVFKMSKATDTKYIDFQRVKKLPVQDRFWRPLVNNAIIDYSWHPDATDPPYIYVFGNQWYSAETMPTYQYRVKNATEKKYINEVKATLLNSKDNWDIPENIDDSEFDYSWVPNPNDPPYTYKFGTQWQKTGGPVFKMKNAIDVKYVNFQKVKKLPDLNNRCWRPLVSNAEIDKSWHPDETETPYIYVFGNQWYDAEIMPTYQYRINGATEKKYIQDIKATLLPNKENWDIPEDVDDSSFDYSWIPNPFEPPYIWEFGTQWQKTGGPKFVTPNANAVKYSDLQKVIKLPNMRNWRIIENIEYFDYSWHPDETNGIYNYIFGNQYHKSENMPTLMYKMKGAKDNKYVNDLKPYIKIDKINFDDSVIDALNSHKDETKYICVSNLELNYSDIIMDDAIPHVHIIDNVAAVVPKGTKTQVYDKLHDYPYVKYHNLGYTNKPLDIIFLSNGEEGAEENYNHLLELVKGLPNTVIGLKNIKGRVASQHQAANIASTPWYFLINGKCKVNPNFDFSWQPDRMCTARHYIFRATNPVNGLEYGHMAIVANNKRLTLNTTGKGLDFTLDSPHAVVPIHSGIGIFNTSEWDTWRTAFREVIKLKHNIETFNDKASKERLHVWITVANGDFADWSLRGANEAVKYYESVNGDFDSLKLSYDWEWLKTKFDTYRP